MTHNKSEAFYGNKVVFASWLGAFCLFGFRSTFAVLKDPISISLDWSQAQVTLAYSLMMVCYAVTAFFSGVIIDRWGTRLAYLLAAITGGLSFFLSSRTSSLYGFYLTFGLLGGISTGMLWITSIVSVRKWYVGSSYATMWGLAFAGAPMSQLLLSYLTRWILSSDPTHSWRMAMMLLGIIVSLLLLLAAWFAKDAPEHYGMHPKGDLKPKDLQDDPKVWGVAETFKTWSIWAAIIVFLASMTGEFLIWTQVISFWTTDLNWTIDKAVKIYALIGFSGIFAMPIVGVASDFIVRRSSTEPKGRKRVLIVGPLVGLIACVLLILSQLELYAYISAIIFAFYWAAIPGGVVGYVGSIYGREALGKIWGLATFIVMGIGPFVGSYVGAYLKDLTGSYTYSLYFAACSFILSLFVAFFLPIRQK